MRILFLLCFFFFKKRTGRESGACKKNAPPLFLPFWSAPLSPPLQCWSGKGHRRRPRNFRAFFLQHPLHSCWAVNIEVGVQGGSVLCVGVLVGRAFFLHDPVPKIDLVSWLGCFEGVNLGGPCNTQIVPLFAGSCAWFLSHVGCAKQVLFKGQEAHKSHPGRGTGVAHMCHVPFHVLLR